MTNFVILVLGESLHKGPICNLICHCHNHITVIANILTLASISFFTPTLEPFLKQQVCAINWHTMSYNTVIKIILCTGPLVQPESTEDWSCLSLWSWDLHVVFVSCWCSFWQIGMLRCPCHLLMISSVFNLRYHNNRDKENSSYLALCCLASATFSLVQLISLDDREFT